MKTVFLIVFSVLLILFFCSCNRKMTKASTTPDHYIHGYVAPGFEKVYETFQTNFRTKQEDGAALTVYYRGEKIVDLWGGYLDKNEKRPWTKNSMCLFFSATKGTAALALAKLHNDGYLDYDRKVADYWPGFAQNGKEQITVRQLLAHQAGLCLLKKKIPLAKINDKSYVQTVLEQATPMWTPGTRNGYSAGLLGLYMRELCRMVDPSHRSVNQYLQEELLPHTGSEFYIGIPDTLKSDRIAEIEMAGMEKRLTHLSDLPKGLRKNALNPFSLFMRSLKTIRGYKVNDRKTWLVEEPSGDGIGTARAVASLYSLFVDPSNPLNLTYEARSELYQPAQLPTGGSEDLVMGIDMYYHLGFMKSGLNSTYAENTGVFGFGGASGTNAFADPDYQLSYCYLTNKMGTAIPDIRDKALQQAVYECIFLLDTNLREVRE